MKQLLMCMNAGTHIIEGKVEGATRHHIKLLTSKKALRTKMFLHIGSRMKAVAETKNKITLPIFGTFLLPSISPTQNFQFASSSSRGISN